MTFEVDLRTRAKAALPGKTVEWDVRPARTAYPACILETISGRRAQHMGGFNGFQATLVQFSCFATTKKEAVEMREALISSVTPEDVTGSTTFLRMQDIVVRQRPQNTEAGFVYCEIVEATAWHD